MGMDSNVTMGGGVRGGGAMNVAAAGLGGVGFEVRANGDVSGGEDGSGRGGEDGTCTVASAWAGCEGGGSGSVGNGEWTREASMEMAVESTPGESGLLAVEEKSGEAGLSAEGEPGLLGMSTECFGLVRIRGPDGARDGRSCAEDALLAGCGVASSRSMST